MLKGPTKSLKRHYAPRAGPACRHWLKQLPGHLKSCKMIEILEKQAAGSHAGDAVLIGTTGPSHREAWIRLCTTQLWWDFVKKSFNLQNCRTLCPHCFRQPAILQSTITLKAHDKAAISSCHLQTQKHSWILLNGSRMTLLALPPVSLPIRFLPTRGALKVAALVPLPAQAWKRSRRSIFSWDLFFWYYPRKRTIECKFPY